MLTQEELQYLTWVTATQYTGFGTVVDLGPWVGSSTAALAEGLRQSGLRGRVVHSYDLFEWRRDYMEQVAPENLPEGSDFRPLFLRHLAPYRDLVEADRMDLFQPAWNKQPIEILFVDAAKSWGLLDAILRGFGPYLVPGKSRVILQDFRFFHTYWLPLVFDSRPDLWRETEGVSHGTTVSFCPLKALYGPVGLHEEYSDDAFPLESARHVLQRRIAEPRQHVTYLMVLYRVACVHGDEMLMAEVGGQILAATASQEHGAMEASMEQARQYSAWDRMAKAWLAIDAGDLERAREAVAPSYLDARADALVARGRVEQLDGNLQQAVELFAASRRIEDRPALGARLFIAECQVQLGNYSACTDEVVQYLEEHGRENGDKLVWGAQILESCWNKEQNASVAKATTKRLQALFSKSAAIILLSAVVARATGAADDARRLARAALDLDPSSTRARELLG